MADILDTTGLKCPMPVIRAEARLRRMQPGQELTVLADDPMARIDIPHFCREAGHRIRETGFDDGICVFQVTCGPKMENPPRPKG